MRVARALKAARRLPGWNRARGVWLKDLARDRTRNRVRRFGQAMVLATELPPDTDWIYAHFLHTPSSVARYAALMTGLPWSFSAHAKDIWTIPEWEKREKLADARWGVTCTRMGHRHLAELAPVPERMELLYHGLEFGRFPPEPGSRPPRTGADPTDPVILLSVGRAVEKKGFDVALAALALLPPDLAWRWVHIGGGTGLKALKAEAERLGIDGQHRLAGRPAAGCRDRQPHQRRPVLPAQPHGQRRRPRRPAQCADGGPDHGLARGRNPHGRHPRTGRRRRNRRPGRSRRRARLWRKPWCPSPATRRPARGWRPPAEPASAPISAPKPGWIIWLDCSKLSRSRWAIGPNSTDPSATLAGRGDQPVGPCGSPSTRL